MPYYCTKRFSLHHLPKHFRVVVVGGGIHGVGIAHDLASRGWKDVLLLEKATLGAGTSSWSTKLIHGGLRYLEHPTQIGMVKESLKERHLLCELMPDLVKPISLLYPIQKKGGRSAFAVKTGLWLYDKLAGKHNIEASSEYSLQALAQECPRLDTQMFAKAYRFWDAQTDDLAMVMRVASSAVKCGATLMEGAFVERVHSYDHGYSLVIRDAAGERVSIDTSYVVMATGPWTHELLSRSKIQPPKRAINNKGAHLLFDDIGLQSGLFLESRVKGDSRIFFVLPWNHMTLVGTTEGIHGGKADDQVPSSEEIHYLLNNVNGYFKQPLNAKDIRYVFSGLRWLIEPEGSLSATSRESLLVPMGDPYKQMWVIYGGKLTSYRLLAKRLGDKMMAHGSSSAPSLTHEPKQWATASEDIHKKLPSVAQRFISVS